MGMEGRGSGGDGAVPRAATAVLAAAVLAAAVLAGLPDAPVALAHGGAARPAGWTGAVRGADPWVLVPLILTGGLYALGTVRLRRAARRACGWPVAAFAAGWLTLAVALVSPLDGLAGRLFVAHMVQHELLMVVAAPLLVLGRPAAPLLWGLPRAWRRPAGLWVAGGGAGRAWRTLTRPGVAFAVFAIVLWGWHAPALYQAAVVDEGVHAVQHLSFLAAAVAYWSSVLDPRRLAQAAPAIVLSLVGTAVHGNFLGALLTFAPSVWYPVYGSGAAILGLTPLEDQQLGGLVMWVPAGLVHAGAALVLTGWSLGRIELRAHQRERRLVMDP